MGKTIQDSKKESILTDTTWKKKGKNRKSQFEQTFKETQSLKATMNSFPKKFPCHVINVVLVVVVLFSKDIQSQFSFH